MARSVFAIPVADFIPILDVNDCTRWTVDVPILLGTSLLWSQFGTSLRLSIPLDGTEQARDTPHMSGVKAGWRSATATCS